MGFKMMFVTRIGGPCECEVQESEFSVFEKYLNFNALHRQLPKI